MLCSPSVLFDFVHDSSDANCGVNDQCRCSLSTLREQSYMEDPLSKGSSRDGEIGRSESTYISQDNLQ